MSKETCTQKICPNYGKPYCRNHGIGITIRNKPKPAAKRSKKLNKVMRKEYVPAVKEMVAAGTLCKVNSPECTNWAQGFHHLAGRIGELLTDKKRKIPCCNACNTFIERNDAWARANGFKDSKFSIPAKNQRILSKDIKNKRA